MSAVIEQISVKVQAKEIFYYEDGIVVTAMQGYIDSDVTFFEVKENHDYFFDFTIKENIYRINGIDVIIQTYLRLHGVERDLEKSIKVLEYTIYPAYEIQYVTFKMNGDKNFTYFMYEVNDSHFSTANYMVCDFNNFALARTYIDSIFYYMVVPFYSPKLYKFLLSTMQK